MFGYPSVPQRDARQLSTPTVGRGGVGFRWLVRPRRVLLLLAAIWVLNVFDLGYTLLESTRHQFVEMNPVAAPLIDAPARLLVAYKATLVVIGSALLLMFARHSTTEWACWFLLATYVYVGIRWSIYYADLHRYAVGPLSDTPRLAFDLQCFVNG